MSKKYAPVTANVVATTRPTVGSRQASRLARVEQDSRAHHDATIARRLPAPGQSAVVRARVAGPHHAGPPGDGGFGDPGDQAGLGLQLRLPAGPVHRDRAAGGRALALALVFA